MSENKYNLRLGSAELGPFVLTGLGTFKLHDQAPNYKEQVVQMSQSVGQPAKVFDINGKTLFDDLHVHMFSIDRINKSKRAYSVHLAGRYR